MCLFPVAFGEMIHEIINARYLIASQNPGVCSSQRHAVFMESFQGLYPLPDGKAEQCLVLQSVLQTLNYHLDICSVSRSFSHRLENRDTIMAMSYCSQLWLTRSFRREVPLSLEGKTCVETYQYQGMLLAVGVLSEIKRKKGRRRNSTTIEGSLR